MSFWSYLYTWIFYDDLSKGSYIKFLLFLSFVCLLNSTASQSTLKFSDLKQPLFLFLMSPRASSVSLSQAQTVSAGPSLLSGPSGGSARSWQVRG